MKIIVPNTQDILSQLSKKTAFRYEKFRQEFPDLNEQDIRVATLGRCANTVESVLYSCIFQNEQLTEPTWYNKISYLKNVTDSQIKSIQENYESFLRVAFVTEYFGIFEWFFRVLLKKIIPTSDKIQAYKIIETILKEFALKNDQRIFDFYRFIRNSLHNNGIITDKHTYPIMYNGIIYELKPETFMVVDWVLISELSWDMQECLDKIIHSEKIVQLSEILDPSFPGELGYSIYDPNRLS